MNPPRSSGVVGRSLEPAPHGREEGGVVDSAFVHRRPARMHSTPEPAKGRRSSGGPSLTRGAYEVASLITISPSKMGDVNGENTTQVGGGGGNALETKYPTWSGVVANLPLSIALRMNERVVLKN
jgi:hypothetical protein